MENATALVLQLHKEGKITTEEAMTLLNGLQPKTPDIDLQPNTPVNPITIPYVPVNPQCPWTTGDPIYPNNPLQPWITYCNSTATNGTDGTLKSNQPNEQ